MDRGGPPVTNAGNHVSVASSVSGRFLEDLLNEYNYYSANNTPNESPDVSTSTLGSDDGQLKRIKQRSYNQSVPNVASRLAESDPNPVPTGSYDVLHPPSQYPPHQYQYQQQPQQPQQQQQQRRDGNGPSMSPKPLLKKNIPNPLEIPISSRTRPIASNSPATAPPTPSSHLSPSTRTPLDQTRQPSPVYQASPRPSAEPINLPQAPDWTMNSAAVPAADSKSAVAQPVHSNGAHQSKSLATIEERDSNTPNTHSAASSYHTPQEPLSTASMAHALPGHIVQTNEAIHANVPFSNTSTVEDPAQRTLNPEQIPPRQSSHVQGHQRQGSLSHLQNTQAHQRQGSISQVQQGRGSVSPADSSSSHDRGAGQTPLRHRAASEQMLLTALPGAPPPRTRLQSEQAIKIRLRDSEPKRSSEETPRPGRGWLRTPNLRVTLRGRSSEDLRVSQPKGTNPRKGSTGSSGLLEDPTLSTRSATPATITPSGSEAISATSGSSKYSISPPKSSTRSFFSSTSSRTRDPSPSKSLVSNSPNVDFSDKKKGFTWNPFGRRRDKKLEVESSSSESVGVSPQRSSPNTPGTSTHDMNGNPVMSTSTGSDLGSMNLNKSTSSMKRAKFSSSREPSKKEDRLQLDLTNFSMDPSFVPYDVVSPLSGRDSDSAPFPTPIGFSPDRTLKNLPAPVPPSSGPFAVGAAGNQVMFSQATSTWQPPESWGTRLDAGDSSRAATGPTSAHSGTESGHPTATSDHVSVRSWPVGGQGFITSASSAGELRTQYEEPSLDDSESIKGSLEKLADDRVCAFRLFRRDGTFATISCREHTTAGELLVIMAKKSLISDFSKFNIVMVRRGMERILGRAERPLIIQRRLFEQVGYTPSDRIELLGREDHSYLVRFVFKEISTGQEIHPDYWRSPAFRKSVVSVANSNISNIPVALFHFANEIKQLDLSRNLNIQDLPNDLAQAMDSLQILSMSRNEICKVPKSLRLLRTLSDIDLSYNRISTLEGAGFEVLAGLTKLKLAGNFIDRIPEDIPRACQQLQYLDLSNNRLRSFPMDLCRYNGQSLKYLNLSFCRIKAKIPDAVGELRNLVVLKLTGNRMYGGLPWKFGELQELRELDLRGNSFGNSGGEELMVMEVLCRCRKLDTLRLDANRIRWVGRWGARTTESLTQSKRRSGEMSDDILEDEGNGKNAQTLDYTALKQFSLSFQYDNYDRPMLCRISNLSGTLTELDLSYSGIEFLPKRFFQRLPGLLSLNLSGNRLRELPEIMATSTKQDAVPLPLRELFVSNNVLESLPADIGDLAKLVYLDAKRNYLRTLPTSIWRCKSLKVLNLTSNRLEVFPSPLPEDGTVLVSGFNSTFSRGQPTYGFTLDRSAPSNYTVTRRMSHKVDEAMLASQLQQSSQQVTLPPLSHVLESLYLSDNYLGDDLYMALYHLPNLLILHTSFNDITDITPWVVAIPLPVPMTPWFQKLQELHLSGNLIGTLPGEIERMRSLRMLFLNGNKLSTVPGEVGKLKSLEGLDLGSQVGGRGEGTGLRYNVSNWPYDWNWNWNLDLRYLNLSGNKRLEIKPSATAARFLSGPEAMPPGNAPNPAAGHKVGARGGAIQAPATSGALVASPSQRRRDLTDFNALSNLRLLGLMDVTCLIVPPDESADRRVRTTGSEVPIVGIPGGSVRYGVADCLARANPSEPLLAINCANPPSLPREAEPDAFDVWDLVIPKFRGRDNEALFGVFDGRGTPGGAKMAKYLNEWFHWFLANELEKIGKGAESGPSLPGTINRERHSEVGQGLNLPSKPDVSTERPERPVMPRSAPGSIRQSYQARQQQQAANKAAGKDNKQSGLEANEIMQAIRRTFIAVNRELGSMGDEIEDNFVSSQPQSQNQPRNSSESKRWEPLSKTPSKRTAEGNQAPSHKFLHGASAMVVFLLGRPAGRRTNAKCTLYIANVGDGMVVMSKAGGLAEVLAQHHALDLVGLSRAEARRIQTQLTAAAKRAKAAAVDDQGDSATRDSPDKRARFDTPPEVETDGPLLEMERVQNAGDWFSNDIKVEGELDVTKAIGYFPFLGAVNAEPWIRHVDLELTEDEDGSLTLGADHDRSNSEPSGDVTQPEPTPAIVGSDEFVVLASGAVWKAIKSGGTYEDGAQMVVDIARSTVAYTAGTDLTPASGAGGLTAPGTGLTKSMSGLSSQQNSKAGGGWGTAAMKVRDVALSLSGGRVPGGYLVMVLGLRDLAKKSAWWNARRGSAESSSESLMVDDRSRRGDVISMKDKKKRGMEESADAIIKEITPPTGRLALVFTDIKNSTSIWENNPVAMRAALRLHHQVMRRLLRQTGGYEVKTEGDAFMVSFQNVASAAEWCLTVQGELLSIDWPSEILSMGDGSDIYFQKNGPSEFVNGAGLKGEDDTGEASDMEVELVDDGRRIRNDSGKKRDLIFKGLSVRMGIHFGTPLCEVDPITSRMDYYGPMVNRAARVTGASQGGQILISSDAMKELQKALGWWGDDSDVSLQENVQSGKDLTDFIGMKGEDALNDEVARLKRLGIVTWCIGEVKLKGLETPEVIYAIYRRELLMRHRFFALEQSGGLDLNAQPQRKADEELSQEKLIKVDKALVQSLASICLRLEWLAARCSESWRDDDGSSSRGDGDYSSSSSFPATPLEDNEGEWAVEGIEDSDRAGLIRSMEGIVARIENAASILYLTRSPFSRVLQSLGAAIETDPNHLLRALQLYAEELDERKRRKSLQREHRREEKERAAAARRERRERDRDRDKDKDRERDRDRDRDKDRDRSERRHRSQKDSSSRDDRDKERKQ